jgi:hypothetical protein
MKRTLQGALAKLTVRSQQYTTSNVFLFFFTTTQAQRLPRARPLPGRPPASRRPRVEHQHVALIYLRQGLGEDGPLVCQRQGVQPGAAPSAHTGMVLVSARLSPS